MSSADPNTNNPAVAPAPEDTDTLLDVRDLDNGAPGEGLRDVRDLRDVKETPQ